VAYPVTLNYEPVGPLILRTCEFVVHSVWWDLNPSAFEY